MFHDSQHVEQFPRRRNSTFKTKVAGLLSFAMFFLFFWALYTFDFASMVLEDVSFDAFYALYKKSQFSSSTSGQSHTNNNNNNQHTTNIFMSTTSQPMVTSFLATTPATNATTTTSTTLFPSRQPSPQPTEYSYDDSKFVFIPTVNTKRVPYNESLHIYNFRHSNTKVILSILNNTVVEKYNSYNKLLKMLILIGVRSSGSTEFNSYMENEFNYDTICLTQFLRHNNETNISKMSCSEPHFWDKYNCLQLAYFNDSLHNNNNSNNSKIWKVYTSTNWYWCNAYRNVNMYNNNYFQRRNNYWWKSKTISNQIETIYYEKTPRYYLFPHIAYIYGKHNLFQRAKMFLLLRDPVKTLESIYYDQTTTQQQSQSNGYKLYYQEHFLNNQMFNYIKDELLAKYISHIENNQNNQNNDNIAATTQSQSLYKMYDQVERLYKNFLYIEGFGFHIDDVKKGKSLAFRNCPIIPLISWFKIFDYWKYFTGDKMNKYNSNNQQRSVLNNRFIIVQSEYFFDNLETVSNRLHCWALGYNPFDNCTTYIEDDGRNVDGAKKYKWIHINFAWRAEMRLFNDHTSVSQKYPVPKEYVQYLAQWFTPCTKHLLHVIETIEANDASLILGDFVPSRWKMAMMGMT